MTGLEKYHKLRAMDGATVLLCRPDQVNAVCRGQLVAIDFFGWGTELMVDFPEPLGKVRINADMITEDGLPRLIFHMTMPADWTVSGGCGAQWCVEEVYIEIIRANAAVCEAD